MHPDFLLSRSTFSWNRKYGRWNKGLIKFWIKRWQGFSQTNVTLSSLVSHLPEICEDLKDIKADSRLYEMQKVPEKIAPKNWAYQMKHHTTYQVYKIWFTTLFHRGLLRNWSSKLKLRVSNVAFRSGYFSKNLKWLWNLTQI